MIKIWNKIKDFFSWIWRGMKTTGGKILTVLGITATIALASTGGPVELSINSIQDKYDQATEIKAEYRLEKTGFIIDAEDQHSIKIEVGDKTKDDFVPELNISRWDAEVSFKIKPRLGTVADKDKVFNLDGDKIKFETPKIDYHFYDLGVTASHTEGAYEFELTLKEKPLSNVITFDIETNGLDFYYQPELTQEEIDDGANRPDNVVGSYAVYHSGNPINYEGGKLYKSGKAFHIFRPQMEDANGWKVWGELNINTDTNEMSVTIPQDFINNAVYPIRHATGATFGYTTIGGSQSSGSVGTLYTFPFSLSVSGSVSKLTDYERGNTATTNIKGIIYDDDTSYPDALQGSPSIPTSANTSEAWRDLTFSSAIPLAAGTYWLTHVVDTASVYKWDAEAGGYRAIDSYASPADPYPGGATAQSRKLSIYATYLPDEGSLDLESGSSQYAKRADGSLDGLDWNGAQDFTVEAWIKLESQPAENFFYVMTSHWETTGNDLSWMFFYWNNAGTKRLALSTSANGSASENLEVAQTLNNDTWYHVAVTWDASAGAAEFFVNGSSIGTDTGSINSLHDTAAPFIVGGRDDGTGGTQTFDGLIDEVRAWDDIRTDPEIVASFFKELDGDETNLQGYWQFSEGSYIDSGPNGNTLTPVNSPVFSIDIPFFEASIDLEAGSDQYLSIADGDLTDLDWNGAVDFTAEAWVNIESLPSGGAIYTIAGKRGATGSQRTWNWGYFDDSGTLKFNLAVSSAGSGGDSLQSVEHNLATGSWTHVAVTWDASEGDAEFFVDGSSIGSDTTGTVNSLFNSTAPVTVGAIFDDGTGARFWDGKIDELRLWTDIRTDEELGANFCQVIVGDEAGLAAYWPLNNQYFDITGNDNTLTPINAPVFSTDVQTLPTGVCLAAPVPAAAGAGDFWIIEY